MRKLLLIAFLFSAALNGQKFESSGSGGGASYTGVVGSLPATCTEGAIAIVTDADALDDCSTGSSTLENVCLCGSSNNWQDEDIGGSTGDTITVNGAAATDADFDDADPAAPANATNVKWQLNVATAPDSISAYVNWALVESITRGGGASASFTTTYSVTGTNTVVTHGNNVFDISTGLLQEGGNEVPNDTDHLGFFAATTSAQLAGVLSNKSGSDLFVLSTSPTIATPILTGKIDRNNVAVDDDDCTGEQGIGWYDTTDSAWEFCNANSGVPATLGGAEINDLEADDPPNVAVNEAYIGTGPGAGAWTGAPVLATSVSAPFFVSGAADPADAEAVRLGNAECVAFELATPGADAKFCLNASDLFDFNLGLTVPTGGILYDSGGVFGAGTGPCFGDGDTCIFEASNNVLRINIGGSERYNFRNGALTIPDGTVSSPGLAFFSESGTGIFKIGSGNVGFSMAGVKFGEFGGSQTFLCSDGTATTGNTNCVARAGAGEAGNVWEAQDENSNVLTGIAGIATLGTETLDEVDFATHVEWDVTGDFLDSGGNCAYTHSSGVGTCTQIEADLALTPAIANVRYSFTYTISGATGDAALTITTAFALTAVSLSVADGTFTTYFTSAVAPANFVFDGTSTSGGITIDDVSLKQVIGGDLVSRGTIRPFVGPLEPYDCTEARWGDLYFDTTDGMLCLCANESAADEWQKMSDGTTDCSI